MSEDNYKILQIPRPSLSSSSQSSDSLRRSSTGGIRSHNSHKRHHHHHHHHHNRIGSSSHSTSTSSSSSIHKKLRSQNLEKLHRGSRSSQGSSSEGNLSLHVSRNLNWLQQSLNFQLSSERFIASLERSESRKVHETAREEFKVAEWMESQQIDWELEKVSSDQWTFCDWSGWTSRKHLVSVSIASNESEQSQRVWSNFDSVVDSFHDGQRIWQIKH